MNKSQRGLVQVYTGPGKGKTTAALGLAIRAVGHGLNPILIRFAERDFDFGEHHFVSDYHPFEIVRLNKGRGAAQSKEEFGRVARQTLAYAEQVLSKGDHDVVILDDIFVAIDSELIDIKDLMHLIDIKPPWVELVLTGPSAPQEVIKRADLVTQMLLIKHPFYEGIGPRKGIDY